MFERAFKSYCSFRTLQFFFCLICFTYAVLLLDNYTPIQDIVKYSLITVTTAFTFITFLDLWALCLPRPMPWNVWVMVCTAGALFFFLGCGLLIACHDYSAWHIMFAVCYAITAILFLLELTLLFWMALMEGSMKTGIKTFTARDHETKIMQIRERTPPLQPGRPVREEIIVPHRVCEVVEGKCYTPKARPRSEELAVQYPSDVESRNAAHSGRIHKDKKLPTTTSYGGTFHVSKDAVPMPSPCAGACKAVEYDCGDTRTVSVSTRLVFKNCNKIRCSSQPSSPRKSPIETRRSIRSALPLDNSLEYDVSTAGTQIPAICYKECAKARDKKTGTAPVNTNEGYTSMSSFVHQKSEKVQVHSRPKPTKEAETVTGSGEKGLCTTKCYNSVTRSGGAAANTGMMACQHCGRCGRCIGYYWLPAHGQRYSYTQPSTSYQTYATQQQTQLDSTPTRDCCPCPPSVKQQMTQQSGPVTTATQQISGEPDITSSDTDSNDVIMHKEPCSPHCTPGTASDRHSSANSGIRYNTTIMDDDDIIRRKKQRKYKWMPKGGRSRRSECSIQ